MQLQVGLNLGLQLAVSGLQQDIVQRFPVPAHSGGLGVSIFADRRGFLPGADQVSRDVYVTFR
jgi:hypothetical protein